VTGWWELATRVEESSMTRYQGLELGYRIYLERQPDGRIVGEGQKWSEAGDGLPRARRTPIRLAGELRGDRLDLGFVEHGTRRTTRGSLVLRVEPGGRRLAGSFRSEAAESRGPATARRIP
jgi:hypothetical protein